MSNLVPDRSYMETSIGQKEVDPYSLHKNLIYNPKRSIKKDFQIKRKFNFSVIEI